MTDDDAMNRLHDAWDRFIAEVGNIIRGVGPAVVSNIETKFNEPEPEPEPVDPTAGGSPTSTEDPPPLTAPTLSEPSSDPTPSEPSPEPSDNPLDPAGPPSNIAPNEDQSQNTEVATQTETFSPGASPAESVSDGVAETTMPVAADPQATADAEQAAANAHPTVSADNVDPLTGAPMPDDVAKWLAANKLTAQPDSGPAPV